jgi:hypothetical protein
MYSKIPLMPWARNQTGATLTNIPDYQTLPILISIYQTLVRPALMYGTERRILIIWSSEGKRIENKVQSRTVPASPYFIRTITAARFQKEGHLQGMGKNEIPRRIINSKLEESRTVGRPKFGGRMVWWKTCGHWGSKDGGWSPGTASLG